MPVLPPVLIWTLGAMGAAALLRLIVREHARVNEELERARAEPVPERARRGARRLRRDPRTGVYRPE
jgi:hypothetical protein